MSFIISAGTDVGLVKKVNQDSFTVKRADTASGEAVLAVMCDGMGGFSSGEIASATVVSLFSNWFINRFSEYDLEQFDILQLKSEWIDIADSANKLISSYGKQNNIQLGTTVVCSLFFNGHYYCINIGDSRMYLFQSDSFSQLSKDQSFVQKEIDLGHITYEESLNHSKRNVLLQCIGCCRNLKPDFYFGEYDSGDIFLLCSDGFRHEVKENEMLERFACCDNSEDLKQELEFLIRLNMERGETDNISALLVKAV